jgi:hypothetical protein
LTGLGLAALPRMFAEEVSDEEDGCSAGMLQDERTHCENWVRGEMRRLLEPGAEPLVVPCSLVCGCKLFYRAFDCRQVAGEGWWQ